MKNRLTAIFVICLFLHKGYSQNIEKIELYSMPFNSMIEFDLDVDRFEKNYLPDKSMHGIFDTIITNKKVLSKFEASLAKLHECNGDPNIRALCYVYFKDGNKKTLAFGYDQTVFYAGKYYSRSPKLFKAIKKILPKKMRKHVGLVKRGRGC